MFHPLDISLTEGVELPELFTNPFDYEPHPLVEVAREQLCSYVKGVEEWQKELSQGKMFGVLIVEDRKGQLGFLAAFSGYLDKQTLHPYFVPPIVNLLDPNGFFAREEVNISQINREIATLDLDPNFAEARTSLSQIIAEQSSEIERLKDEYQAARLHRRELRAAGGNIEQLNAESQRQKGLYVVASYTIAPCEPPLSRLSRSTTQLAQDSRSNDNNARRLYKILPLVALSHLMLWAKSVIC